jgi:hypothetical protein
MYYESYSNAVSCVVCLQLSTWLERRELMDLVVLKPLMVNRGVHRLNNKLL